MTIFNQIYENHTGSIFSKIILIRDFRFQWDVTISLIGWCMEAFGAFFLILGDPWQWSMLPATVHHITVRLWLTVNQLISFSTFVSRFIYVHRIYQIPLCCSPVRGILSFYSYFLNVYTSICFLYMWLIF